MNPTRSNGANTARAVVPENNHNKCVKLMQWGGGEGLKFTIICILIKWRPGVFAKKYRWDKMLTSPLNCNYYDCNFLGCKGGVFVCFFVQIKSTYNSLFSAPLERRRQNEKQQIHSNSLCKTSLSKHLLFRSTCVYSHCFSLFSSFAQMFQVS